jgi:hypothetical protein
MHEQEGGCRMNHRYSLDCRRALATTLLTTSTVLFIVSSPGLHAVDPSRTNQRPDTPGSQGASVIVPFDTDHWYLDDGSAFVPFGGRRALAGTAYLKGVSFLNGTIEADAWITGEANFAGFLFRTQSFDESEWFWLRTAKTNGLISDAIQYAPSFHRVFCWQLRPDGIGPANVPKNQWVHMKLEVLNDSAALYVNDMARPALKVESLGLGLKPGSTGLKMLSPGSVYFSSFSYRIDDSTPVVAKPATMPPNVLAGWQMSPSYPIANVADVPASYPAHQIEEVTNWIRPDVDTSGLVNITKYLGTKYHGRAAAAGGRPTYAILRTFIDADRDRRVRMNFGYSDAATIFLNRNPLFSGNSAFVSRNIAYGGWISFNDAVFLDLKRGRNELVAVVAEDFGGWGWQARLDDVDGITLRPAQK